MYTAKRAPDTPGVSHVPPARSEERPVRSRRGAQRRESAVASDSPSQPAAAPRQINFNSRTLQRILNGALAALSRRGASQLSMTDVCDAAGVSRATFYRYFSHKGDLLVAVGEYVSRNFIDGVKCAIASSDSPVERLRNVLTFVIRYTAQIKTDRILEVEPSFVLQFLQSHFAQHVAVFNEALSPVYDDFETHLGIPMNRLLVSELLLRAEQSTSVIPAGRSWGALPEALAQMLEDLYCASATGRTLCRR
jgi:AcrR family transcriptional regulator